MKAPVHDGGLRDRCEIAFVTPILVLNAAVYIVIYSFGTIVTTPIVFALMLMPRRTWKPVLRRVPDWQGVGLRFSDRTKAWIDQRFPGFFPLDDEPAPGTSPSVVSQ